ncbi:hypothetical protein PMI07_001071 [Rhizobium sp. CF080]|uniref:hypothetical protein n=1 Tax=Rhizobium sp. (strain CF080) TaxID=1144310 RepID=UPI0002717844|nr:hypothetical protein [Rhizobium sp. CF080]EUB96737.1 hypothetical protein PMI07_001071 [Rhizobium sp. CF080]
MTKITSAIAAAFIASVSFAGAALAAEGEYYQDTAKASATVDRMQTGSIAQSGKSTDVQARINSGDYFDGVNRPN